MQGGLSFCRPGWPKFGRITVGCAWGLCFIGRLTRCQTVGQKFKAEVVLNFSRTRALNHAHLLCIVSTLSDTTSSMPDAPRLSSYAFPGGDYAMHPPKQRPAFMTASPGPLCPPIGPISRHTRSCRHEPCGFASAGDVTRRCGRAAPFGSQVLGLLVQLRRPEELEAEPVADVVAPASLLQALQAQRVKQADKPHQNLLEHVHLPRRSLIAAEAIWAH